MIPAMDHCLPGQKVFASRAEGGEGREKQPLREIAIAMIVARVGPPDLSGGITFINSDVKSIPREPGERKPSPAEAAFP